MPSKSKSIPQRPELQETEQLSLLPAPTVVIDQVPTLRAKALLNVKRMRPGLSYECKTRYGGKLIATWAGVNPENRRENLWDILHQKVS